MITDGCYPFLAKMWVHFISKGFGFRKSILKNKQQSHISKWQLIVRKQVTCHEKCVIPKKGYMNKFHIEVFIFIAFYQDLRSLNGSLYKCWVIFFFLWPYVCPHCWGLLGWAHSLFVYVQLTRREHRLFFFPVSLPEAGNASCQRFIE